MAPYRRNLTRRQTTVLCGIATVVLIHLLNSAYSDFSVRSYVISNGGLEMHVLPTGAVIQRLFVPDKSGRHADVVLGFDDADAAAYTDGTSPYFGAIVGRVALHNIKSG